MATLMQAKQVIMSSGSSVGPVHIDEPFHFFSGQYQGLPIGLGSEPARCLVGEFGSATVELPQLGTDLIEHGGHVLVLFELLLSCQHGPAVRSR